jgi:hypothetical protein
VQRKRAEGREQNTCFRKMVYGKFFRKPFSSFCEGFSGQSKMISVDLNFTAKQTPVNDENILQKIFNVETNGTLIKNGRELEGFKWEGSRTQLLLLKK